MVALLTLLVVYLVDSFICLLVECVVDRVACGFCFESGGLGEGHYMPKDFFLDLREQCNESKFINNVNWTQNRIFLVLECRCFAHTHAIKNLHKTIGANLWKAVFSISV